MRNSSGRHSNFVPHIWNQTFFISKHRISFACARLSICEYSGIDSLQNGVNAWLDRVLKHFILSWIDIIHSVKGVHCEALHRGIILDCLLRYDHRLVVEGYEYLLAVVLEATYCHAVVHLAIRNLTGERRSHSDCDLYVRHVVWIWFFHKYSLFKIIKSINNKSNIIH